MDRSVAAVACRRTVRVDELGADRDSLHAAMVLVASGHARRVTLTNIRFGERLLATAVADGADAGLAVRLERSPSGLSRIVIAAGALAAD